MGWKHIAAIAWIVFLGHAVVYGALEKKLTVNNDIEVFLTKYAARR